MAGVTMDSLRVLTIIIIVLTVPGKARFTVQPVSVERAEGLESVFRCRYQGEGLTAWYINNVIVETDTETVRARPPSSPGGPSTLTIVATPQHNNSIVYFRAVIINGTGFVLADSSTASLVVHETVLTPFIVAPNTITVMWSALPLTEYCVEINTTTLDFTETVVLDSLCGFTNEYIFMYSNNSVCARFTVTPTDGEMRGTTNKLRTGLFMRAEGSGEQHRILENKRNKLVKFRATVPSCTRFTRYRVDYDLLIPSIDLSITDPLLFDGSLSFSLPTDKMTEYSVTLTDENGIDLVFENIKISTFDVQNFLVSECPGGGGICVSIEYVEDTVSPGALVCAVRIIDGVFDIKLVTIPRNSSENFTIPVPSGEYRVIAFDLESNYLPRMPISMVALSQDKMTVNSTGEDITSLPPREGISASNLTNGDVSVTCSNSALNCLVLFQSTILDRVIVGFINSSEVSTIISLNGNFGVGYVVVYSWNSLESIFEGKVSLIMQLDLPTSAPTTPPTSGPQTHPPPPDMASLILVIAGIIVVALVVIIILIIVVVMKKVKRGGKVFHSSNSEGGLILDVGASITSQVAFYNVARPENMSLGVNTADTDDELPPGYDIVRKENTQAEYETVPLALAGKPTPTTSENPPPLPPPMIRGDSEAPDLPPPYNPAVDSESVVVMLAESSISRSVENQSVNGEVDESLKIDLSVSDVEHDDSTEEAISSTNNREMGQILDVVCLDTVQGAEEGAGNSADCGGQEGMIATQDVGASIISPVALYDVVRPENMSLECNTTNTDDTPPPGYDVVCKENMQSPEYETIALALAGKASPTTSENPPPLPPPTIQGDEGLENDVVLTEETTSISQAKDEPTEDGGDDGLEAMITAQHQYTLVVPKPASSADKVKDSSKVIYSDVDKDKLVPVVPPPVAKAQGQYIPVETRPVSSDAKVMDSTKVVYVQVDKDKLKPVDLNEPPALPPRRPVTNTEELHTEKTLALPPRRPDTNTEEMHTEKTQALAP